MNDNIKKGLLFLLGALLVFIGGMVALDKLNTAVGINLSNNNQIQPSK